MKKVLLIGTVISASIFATLAYCSGGIENSKSQYSGLDVAPVNNKPYRSECASCHFAYPAGLLPARSWQKLMSGLDDHFGDNAELLPEAHAVILQYLVDNAADTSDYKRSRRIMNSLATDEIPMRISETPYIKRKHHELSPSEVKNNPEVRSLSNCIACHTQTDKGSFNENKIKIPGAPKQWGWD
jgi:hypothetical protein